MPPHPLERYGNRPFLQLQIMGRTAAVVTALRARATPHRDVRRFLIFAQGRSGSTLLTSSLNSHQRIECADEILDRPRGDAVAYLRNRARLCRHDAFGFHVKCYQLSRIHGIDDWSGFLHTLADDGWKIVYLYRENVVRHVISGFFAQASGRYHFKGTERRPERIRIDPERFRAWLQQRTDLLAQERAALAGLPTTSSATSATSRARRIARNRSTACNGARDRAATSALPAEALVDRPLRTLIENYAELVEVLDDTPYADQLD